MKDGGCARNRATEACAVSWGILGSKLKCLGSQADNLTQ